MIKIDEKLSYRKNLQKIFKDMTQLNTFRGLLLNKYEELLTKAQIKKSKKEVQEFINKYCKE